MRLVVTRDDYFTAALGVLAARGHAALKIGPLCRAIGVTTGSFYHYFGSWDGFVADLLAHWEQEKTQRLAVTVSAESDPMQRMRTIKQMAIDLPHDAETALRAWSHTNDAVAAVQRRVDQERLESLRGVLVPIVGSRRRAEQLAIMGLSLLVGLQQWRAPVDVRELRRAMDDYEQLILSHAAVAVG